MRLTCVRCHSILPFLFIALAAALLAVPALAEVTVVVRGPSVGTKTVVRTPVKQLATGPALLLPYYEADSVSSVGRTTAFSVRNNTAEPVPVAFTYFEPSDGASALAEQVVLQPREVRSVNLRDLPNLPVDEKGFRRGFVVAEAIGNLVLPDNVISGDYFVVDPSQSAASGGKLLDTDAAECQKWGHRFFSGGGFDGGLEISFLALDVPGTRVQLLGDVYDEDGTAVATIEVESTERVFSVGDDDLDLPISAGTIEWTFQDGARGTVMSTLTAGGVYSVGVEAACIDGADTTQEPLPDGTVVFELDGTFLVCRGCSNWQFDMPFGGAKQFSKIVLDFEVFVASWDPGRQNGFHCLFWLNNGPKWPDMIAYLNSKGTQGRMTFQTNRDLGSPIGIEVQSTPGLQLGGTYKIHFEYDTAQRITWFEARELSGELRVTDVIQLANKNPVSTSKMFIQFGTQFGHGPESATPNWRFSDFSIQFIP